jgi:hypothetical protein
VQEARLPITPATEHAEMQQIRLWANSHSLPHGYDGSCAGACAVSASRHISSHQLKLLVPLHLRTRAIASARIHLFLVHLRPARAAWLRRAAWWKLLQRPPAARCGHGA